MASRMAGSSSSRAADAPTLYRLQNRVGEGGFEGTRRRTPPCGHGINISPADGLILITRVIPLIGRHLRPKNIGA